MGAQRAPPARLTRSAASEELPQVVGVHLLHVPVRVKAHAAASRAFETTIRFGHEKGAFTGALTWRKGRFEMSEGGTQTLKCNVRVVAATHRNPVPQRRWSNAQAPNSVKPRQWPRSVRPFWHTFHACAG